MHTNAKPTHSPLAETRRDSLEHRLKEAADLLEQLVADRTLLANIAEPERNRLLNAAGRISRPDALGRRQLLKVVKRKKRAEKVEREEVLLASTGIRKLRREPVFITSPNVFPPPSREEEERSREQPHGETEEPRSCYVCKQKYTTVHHFYDRLCAACAELNFAKRTELADLSGRVAVLTGGRVKIGYQAGIKLLRAGARLIVTTRFPRDSAARYGREPDFVEWADRLVVYGLDMRHTPSVEAFCKELLATEPRLDFIINNACQTVRRPRGFYEHMRETETAALSSVPEHLRRLVGTYDSAHATDVTRERIEIPAAPGLGISELAQLPRSVDVPEFSLLAGDRGGESNIFPTGVLDQDLQQLDLRGRNSWRLLLAEVPAVELIEVHLVNAIAPFVINARLKPLMMQTPERDKHIVNVSAVEGQFYRSYKTIRHPHTNMAKAALNMMTRTSAADYVAAGIHMNSVDTGWVTDEDPEEIAARKTAEHRFHPPLDIVDGAARIVDPIISGFNTGSHIWGKFLKDYRPTDW